MLSNLLVGFGVSFLGSLPIGVLNLTSIDIAVTRSFVQAILFALACAIIEYGQAYFAVRFADYLTDHPTIDSVIQIGVIPLFLILGGIFLFKDSIEAWQKRRNLKKEKPKKNDRRPMPPFVRGVLLSIANPLAIPFWLVYSTSLSSTGAICFENLMQIHAFVAGIALGTFVVLCLYGGLGTILVEKLKRYQKWFNEIIGLMLILLAIYQFCRVMDYV